MKPGILTTEFAVTSGSIASILAGVVSSSHAQVIVFLLAGVYTFGRVVVKAVHAWRAPSTPPQP
jgi:hypothetical protein